VAVVVTAAVAAGSSVCVTTKLSYDTENKIMRTRNLKPTMSPGRRPSWMVALAFSLLVVVHAQSSFGQTSQPKTFSSPSEASSALFQAVQSEDEQAVEAILGAGKEVTSSSDEVEDKLERERFSQKYQEMHRLLREADGSTVLYIGAENWPFPIPLVSKNDAWYFDSKSGAEEIKFRRIGENEAAAIQVCEEFAMAKNAADAMAVSEDPITQFAENLARRVPANAYNKESNPFRGYYFRIVAQNPTSSLSGHGKRTRGLTLIAYPAEYQSSGVKTFIVTHMGTVFEKDLGPDTTTVAPGINARSSGWHLAE